MVFFAGLFSIGSHWKCKKLIKNLTWWWCEMEGQTISITLEIVWPNLMTIHPIVNIFHSKPQVLTSWCRHGVFAILNIFTVAVTLSTPKAPTTFLIHYILISSCLHSPHVVSRLTCVFVCTFSIWINETRWHPAEFRTKLKQQMGVATASMNYS